MKDNFTPEVALMRIKAKRQASRIEELEAAMWEFVEEFEGGTVYSRSGARVTYDNFKALLTKETYLEADHGAGE